MSAYVSTRGRRIPGVGATIALSVDGVVAVRTVTRVIVARLVDRKSAKVPARIRAVYRSRPVAVTLAVHIMLSRPRTRPDREITKADAAFVVVERYPRHEKSTFGCGADVGPVFVA